MHIDLLLARNSTAIANLEKMLRALQVCRLTRPSRLRLSIPRRFIASPGRKTNGGRKDGDEGLNSGLRRIEAEDSRMAAELAEKYKQSGIDVRGKL